MPIVLAIEPDRRQAAHLTAIVRHQVGAELLLADTTEGALDAIGNRVPDLVLVPALLSPQDDAALAAALRVIAAAAHVRTLTIPVLANGTKPAAVRGVLAKWRRGRETPPEPDGCEPAVFGEQISAYLREAAAERAQLEEDLFEEAPAWTRAPLEMAIEPDVAESVESSPDAPIPEPVIELDEPLIDLSEELAELSDEEDQEDEERFDGEPVGVYTIAAEPEEPAIDAFDLFPAIVDPAAVAEPEPALAVGVEAFAPTVDQAPAIDALSAEAPDPPRADIEQWEPMYLTPGRLWPALEGVPAEVPAARTEQPDWIELVASLRQDLERRAARPSDGPSADTQPLVQKQRAAQAKKAKPVQDEWGFFDPEQCGFSTLLAKLEEITAT